MALSKPTTAVVKALTGSTLDDAVVSAIIDDAAIIGADCLEPLDAAVQTSALKWLSAHLVASTSDAGSQTLTSEKLGDASVSYARGSLGDGLSGTAYGQQAIAIAPCLGRIGRPKASFERV